jgi:hypothetical protein
MGQPLVVQNYSMKNIEHPVELAEGFQGMFNILRRRKLEERGKETD